MFNVLCKKYSQFLLNRLWGFRKVIIRHKLYDEAWFLNYQDTLNLLSVDPDRK
jgi:hypothetical protein